MYVCYNHIMNVSPNNFFIYVRKSTDESNRQVLSIQAQLFATVFQAIEHGATTEAEQCLSEWSKEDDPQWALH